MTSAPISIGRGAKQDVHRRLAEILGRRVGQHDQLRFAQPCNGEVEVAGRNVDVPVHHFFAVPGRVGRQAGGFFDPFGDRVGKFGRNVQGYENGNLPEWPAPVL